MPKPISPFLTVIVYAICGILWILGTDTLLHYLPWHVALETMQHFKGILFILLSGLLLYWLLKRNAGKLASYAKGYARMFHENPQPMWIFNKKTFRFLQVNEAALHLYGYTREEFLQMTILDIRPEEDIPKVRANQHQRIYTGYSADGDWRHFKKDGSLMYVKIESFTTLYGNSPAEVVSIFDVTGKYLADEALNKQEQLLKTIINSTRNMVWAVSPQLQFIARNEVFRNSASLLTGIEQPTDYWKKYYEKSLLGERQVIEFTSGTTDEEWSYAEIFFDPILHNGKINGVACLAWDITDKKRQELALKKALERYDILTLATNDAIWDLDFATNRVTWNNNALLHFGFGSLENDVSVWQSRIHPEDADGIINSILEAMQEGRHHWHKEYRLLGNKGQYRHTVSRGYILYNDKREAVRMIGALQDVEDKRVKDEEIRRLSLIASMTHTPILITDMQEQIEWVNKSFEDLSGYQLEDVKGMRSDAFLHGPDTNPATLEEIRKKIAASQSCVAEILHYNSEGTPYWVLMDITPVVDASGKVERLIIIQTNITEKKKMAERLEEVTYIGTHRLRAAVSTLQGFMPKLGDSGAAGDLRTVISELEGMLEEMDGI